MSEFTDQKKENSRDIALTEDDDINYMDIPKSTPAQRARGIKGPYLETRKILRARHEAGRPANEAFWAGDKPITQTDAFRHRFAGSKALTLDLTLMSPPRSPVRVADLENGSLTPRGRHRGPHGGSQSLEPQKHTCVRAGNLRFPRLEYLVSARFWPFRISGRICSGKQGEHMFPYEALQLMTGIRGIAGTSTQ